MKKEKAKKSKKGIIGAGCLAAVAAAVINFRGCGGLGFGNGKGDGDGEGTADRTVSVEVTTADEQEQTETTEITTEEISVVELKVNGNEYIFDNTKYSVDETDKLIEDIKAKASTSVKLVDEDASEKAFTTIKQALKDNNISFTETE